MRRRDLILATLVLFLAMCCIQLHQRIGELNEELDNWEESRFEMTRVLSDLQKKLFQLISAADPFGSVGLPSQNDIFKLNVLERKQFRKAFLKYAGRLKLMALSMQFPSGAKDTTEEGASPKTIQTDYPDIWPTEGTITSLFGLRKHPILKTLRFHSGVDIANLKNTEILAAADGTVKFAGPDGGYGNVVILEHGNGFESVYGHAEDILVKNGELVKKGQLIASMGSTGLSTGEHLHYEIRFAGEALDPTAFVK